MSIETPEAAEATPEAAEALPQTPEARRRRYALEWLRSLALQTIVAADEPLRTTDLTREMIAQLELELDEEQAGAIAHLLRLTLDSDPNFAHTNRQWDLAPRTGLVEVDRRRPVERAMEDFIHLLGRPAKPREVGIYTAAIYGRDGEYYAGMLERLAPRSERFFQSPGGRVAIASWLLQITSDDAEEVEWDNFEEPEVLEPARAAAKQAKGKDALAYARAVLDAAAEPLLNTALAYVVWQQFPDTEPQALFNDLFAGGDLLLVPGPCWATPAHREQLIATLREVAGEPELAAELLAAVLPPEEEEAAPVIAFTDEDLEHVRDFMETHLERSFRVSELCQEVLEAFPGSRNFPLVREALDERLRADLRFVWVGGERFRLDGTLPADIQNLPEGLAFDERSYAPDEEEEADKLLPPERWKFNLDEQILHPLAQDVGDDDLEPTGETPGELACSPAVHHYVAGTLYVPRAHRAFFPAEPDLVELTLLASDGSRLEVWLNNRLGVLFHLKEWYDAHLPWSGGRFTLQSTDQADEYRLEHDPEEREALLDVPMERLQELLLLRADAEVSALPLSEVVTRVLRGHEEGTRFITLFAEVNVVRRIRRAWLASALSSQRYFTQSPQEPGIWRFDEKRAEKATRKKGGRRPRAYEEEEDLDLEQ